MFLSRNTKLICDRHTPPVENALRILRRDISRALNSERADAGVIEFCEGGNVPESYSLRVCNSRLIVHAADDLGYVYAALQISRRFLGVRDLWFWNDQEFFPRPDAEIPEGFSLHSTPAAVRYRGWFINDEVLLDHWRIDADSDEPWRMAFEALLRLGGNLVIPGTDHNAHRYRQLAADYGLIITHHHAEPLGAQMFARRYPDKIPSYRKYPAEFEALWTQAVTAQKDTPTIFNIGFRGQGDAPFWADDPTYDTPESRGALLSRLIRRQYDLVQSIAPGATCCTNLYGEILELYQAGHITLPPDIIRIWADNGYGKMVSRRQGAHDPRIRSLPQGPGHHGLYYHVSFYDLQAAGHITTLPNSAEFVVSELTQVLNHGADDLWIINCSNIKPHAYLLSLIARIWQTGKVDAEAYGLAYFSEYYDPGHAPSLLACQKRYWSCTPSFGPLEDQHGADQLANYGVRDLATQYLCDRSIPCAAFRWACDASSLAEQITWFKQLCTGARKNFADYDATCDELACRLPAQFARLFRGSLLLQARVMHLCWRGAHRAARAMLAGLAQEYLSAFYLAGQAREDFLAANEALVACEHGKWRGFYENECLTDIRFTAHTLEGLLHLFRALGDGDGYWRWQRQYLYPPQDRRIVLLTNFEHRLTDLELFEAMRAVREQEQA